MNLTLRYTRYKHNPNHSPSKEQIDDPIPIQTLYTPTLTHIVLLLRPFTRLPMDYGRSHNVVTLKCTISAWDLRDALGGSSREGFVQVEAGAQGASLSSLGNCTTLPITEGEGLRHHTTHHTTPHHTTPHHTIRHAPIRTCDAVPRTTVTPRFGVFLMLVGCL